MQHQVEAVGDLLGREDGRARLVLLLLHPRRGVNGGLAGKERRQGKEMDGLMYMAGIGGVPVRLM